MKVKIDMARATVIAFLLQRSPEITFQEIKQRSLEEIKKRSDFNPNFITFAKFGMPCGNSLIIKTEQDFLALEEKDIPCPCGDPNHWLFRSRVI